MFPAFNQTGCWRLVPHVSFPSSHSFIHARRLRCRGLNCLYVCQRDVISLQTHKFFCQLFSVLHLESLEIRGSKFRQRNCDLRNAALDTRLETVLPDWRVWSKPGAGNDSRLIRWSGLNQVKLKEEKEVCFLLTLTNKSISILNVNMLVYVLIVFRPTVAHLRWFSTVWCLKLLEFLVWGVVVFFLLFIGKC